LTETILNKFFDWAEDNDNMSQLLCMPLNQSERYFLEKLLEKSTVFGADSFALLVKDTIDMDEIAQQQAQRKFDGLLAQKKQRTIAHHDTATPTSIATATSTSSSTLTSSSTQVEPIRLYTAPSPVTKITKARRSSIGVWNSDF